MSNEEYIPDSEAQDDDSDESIPITPSHLKAGQIQVRPVLPDVGTAYGSDKSIPVLQKVAHLLLNSPKGKV